MDRITIRCSCGVPEHQLELLHDVDWNDEVTVFVHLTPFPWYARIIPAIKYLFGYRCRYGCFDEVVLDIDEVDRVVEFLQGVVDTRKGNTQ